MIPRTAAYQAPPSMGFSRQEYWHGLPFPSPGDLPVPGIEPRSPALQTDALPSEPPGKPTCFRLVVKQVRIHSKKNIIFLLSSPTFYDFDVLFYIFIYPFAVHCGYHFHRKKFISFLKICVLLSSSAMHTEVAAISYWRHGRSQTPPEAQDHPKGDQKVNPVPVRTMCQN